MSETPAYVRGCGPFLGEYNYQVLSELLGYQEEQINKLYAAEVLYHEKAVDRLHM
ncbi:MAG TPA: hypothetical protein VN441_07375 [Syntrophomonas sp.]|nr:hypothetical protein [Syntrophomonas sp.]